MRFFIDVKLIFILFIISLVAAGILLIDILISLIRKVSYVSNMIWNRDRFVVWLLSIWLFGIFPLWLALLLWFVFYFLFKHIILEKDIAYVYHLANDQSQNDIICRSFGECIEKLFSKTTTDDTLQKSMLKDEFSFIEYTNTLIVVPLYYLFEVVNLDSTLPISFVIGSYLVTISIFLLLARLTYALLNQPGHVAERGLYSYFIIAIVGFICFTITTIILKNLGYITLL